MNQLREAIQRVNNLGMEFTQDGVEYFFLDRKLQGSSVGSVFLEYGLHYLPHDAIIANIADASSPIVHILDGAAGVCNMVTWEDPKVKEIYLPNTVNYVYSFALSLLNIKSCTLPNSMNNLGRSIFEECKHLESCTLSENLTEISTMMFRNCVRLKAINLPPKLQLIKSSAFSQCGLEEVIMPPQVHTIQSCAFGNCRGLRRLVLNEGLETIGGSAFRGCTSLTSVTIPSTMMELGVDAFRGCVNLKDIRVPRHLRHCVLANTAIPKEKQNAIMWY